jgi:hypothetical protein
MPIATSHVAQSSRREVDGMEIILITVAVVAFLAATPLFSVDSSDSRSESARPAAGWWPAGPDAR